MLKVNSLYVSFTKEYFTLNDISFEIGHNDNLIIIGNKESGRTALIRTLVGLEPIAKGEVYYKDIALEKVDFQNDISLGYIPATPSFLENKTVKQNIEYVLKLRKVNPNFASINVSNALSGFGLDFIKNKKVKELNYFDRLKLALARLSTRVLDIILIDDIYTKLSSMEKEKIIKLIKSLVKSSSCSILTMTDDEAVADMFNYKRKYLVYGSLQDSIDDSKQD